jgi:hypothetical protein
MALSSPFRVAAIMTVYRPLSHSDVMLTRWLEPLPGDAAWGWPKPQTRIASMYVDQFPPNDLARAMCAKHGIPLFPTIGEALTLGGANLAVDGVLWIGEHGDYPFNEFGQKLYPRKQLFDQIIAVFRRDRRVVPMFFDKHLSWNFDWAKEMFATVRELKIPFLAGTSLTHCDLQPPLDLPDGAHITEAVGVFAGPVESYGYHSIEQVQAIVETRSGGETGIRAVCCHRGENVWSAMESGAWSRELMEVAISVSREPAAGDYRENCRRSAEPPVAYCFEHVDGLRVTHVLMPGHVREFSLAVRTRGDGKTHAARVVMGDASNFHASFARLNRSVEELFLTGRNSMPAERTLLATGAIAAAMRALHTEGQRVETPELAIHYP